jgi:hypothetical protein
MLSYDLSVTGVRNVKAALGSIEQEMVRHNARVSRAMGVRRSGTGGKGSVEAEASRAQRATEKANERAHANELRRIEREKQARIKAEQQAATQRQRLQANLSRKQLARFKRETLSRERLEQNDARRRLARFKAETLRSNRLQMASRQAIVGGAYQGAVAPLASVGRTAKMALGLGGAYVVGASLSKQFATERSAAALANKAFGTPGETRTREEIKQSLMSQSEAIGKQTGNRQGVIDAIDKFVAISGNLPAAQQMAQYMADISDATGAGMADVGKTGGQIMQALMARGVGPEDAIKQTEEMMSTMAAQAKIGSIEFSDLATQMGKVISSTARFDGRVSDLTATMSAMAQLSIAGGASSPEEATTAILRFSDDLVQNAGRWEEMMKKAKSRGDIKGEAPSFFTDKSKTQLRGPEEIMFDIFRQTKGDLTQVKKLFGIRSMKALEPFQQTFSVFQRAADQQGGIEAVQQQLDRFRAARMSPEEVRTSAKFARAQTGRKFAIVMEDLQSQVGKELAPAVEELIPAFTELASILKDAAPYLASFLKAFVKNPMLIGGGLLGGRMALGGLAGGIGGAFSGFNTISGITATLGGGKTIPVEVTNFPKQPGTGGAGAGRGTGGVGNIGGAALTGLAAGAVVASGIYTWGTAEVERRDALVNRAFQDLKEGRSKEALSTSSTELAKIEQETQTSKKYSAIGLRAAVGGLAPLFPWLMPAQGLINAENAPELDPLSQQRQMDKRNFEQIQSKAQQTMRGQGLEEFVRRAGEGVTVLDGFYKKLGEFQPPSSSPNRSDSPSPVKN